MRRTTLRRETPVAFIHAILDAYDKRGVDKALVLASVGLRPEDVDPPSGRVGVELFEALCAHAMRELDDEALGWFSRRLPWGSYGMLLRASLPSSTLDIALRRWCRHHNLLAEDIRLRLEITEERAFIGVAETVDLGRFREFCLVSLLRNVHGVACWLGDLRIRLQEVHFPFAPPPHAAAYGRMFDGAIQFHAPEAGIGFDATYLRMPVLRDDAALRRVLREPIRLMARLYRQDDLLSKRVGDVLSGQPGLAEPDAETIAAQLGISVRSLQRRLEDEGTSLQKLKSRARQARSVDLLVRGSLPIKRVAHLTGYKDESSFSRAFRQWTGQSPAEFRRGASPDLLSGLDRSK